MNGGGYRPTASEGSPVRPPSNTPDRGGGAIQPLDLRLKRLWWDARTLRLALELLRLAPEPGLDIGRRRDDLGEEIDKLAREIAALRAAGTS